jgi:UDP-N-acetylmuramoyl-tripeptide--D-alanyl-D-alanine ligase
MAAVRDSELELLAYVQKLIINADDAFLMEGIENRFKGRCIRFGIREGSAEIRAEGIEFADRATKFTLCAGSSRIAVESALPGRFNVYNSLAAAAAAYALGFELNAIKKGLESFSGLPLRLEVSVRGGVTYINDAYNANPSSMEESVREMVRYAKGDRACRRAIAVLGDMLELGPYGADAHIRLGALLSDLHVDILIGAGALMSLAVEAFQGTGIAVGNSRDAGRELENIVREGDVVLVKGSRGMKMEDALAFTARQEKDCPQEKFETFPGAAGIQK